ncbi:MAG: helix-turn-helix transcriptional regulator [Bacteroidota bacterium]
MKEIYIAGISISLFCLLHLWRKEKESPALFWSKLILILWGFRFLIFYLKSSINLQAAPYLILIDQNLFFLDGPLLYFLTRSINQESFHWKKDLLHFIPFVLTASLAVDTYVSMSSADLISTFEQISQELDRKNFVPNWEELLFILAILLHNLIYIFLSVRKTRRYKKKIREIYSTVDQIDLKWLELILKLWLGLMLLPLCFFFSNYNLGLISSLLSQAIFLGSHVLCILFFGLNLLSHSFADTKLLKEKHKKKAAESREDREVYENLLAYMEKEKPYLEVKLGLADLAKAIGVHPNYLSYLINTYSKRNFFDFINSYRIEAIKKELAESDEHIMIIAYNNGFNSKSTFNEIFKRKTTMTPSQYRKKRQK